MANFAQLWPYGGNIDLRKLQAQTLERWLFGVIERLQHATRAVLSTHQDSGIMPCMQQMAPQVTLGLLIERHQHGMQARAVVGKYRHGMPDGKIPTACRAGLCRP